MGQLADMNAANADLGPLVMNHPRVPSTPVSDNFVTPGYSKALAEAGSKEPQITNPIQTAPQADIQQSQPAPPPPSKAHKLLAILQSGLQGALAGRAASEQAVLQSGGRRGGGFGGGFEAGFTLPWQRQQMMNQLAQQQAQTGVLQSEAANYNLPGVGQIPGWLAKAMGPAYLRQQGQLGSAQIGAGARVQGAQISSRFRAVPGVGLFDTQANNGQGAVVPGSEGTIITPGMAEEYGLPQELIGKPLGQATPIASLQRSSVFENVPQMTAQGPIIVNRRNAQATPVTGAGGQRFSPPALATPREVANPNAPGETMMVPAGQSVGMAGPGSASLQAPRAGAVTAAKSEVPTQIGNQKVAFNTALQHADLLQQALTYLNDPKDPSNIRAWNSVKNRFKTEFGSSDVTNFNVIANAYTREVTKMLSGGHLTDSEISTQGATLPANASPQQILGALQSYRALAQSKLNMLNQQVNAAKGGGKEIHYKIVNGTLVPQ